MALKQAKIIPRRITTTGLLASRPISCNRNVPISKPGTAPFGEQPHVPAVKVLAHQIKRRGN